MSLSLGNSSHDVQRQRVSFRHVRCHELDPRFHKGGNEGDVAGQSVKLGDQQHATDAPRLFKGRFQLGATALAGAGLDLGDLGDDIQPADPSEGKDGGLLRFQAEARLALLRSGNAVISDGRLTGEEGGAVHIEI